MHSPVLYLDNGIIKTTTNKKYIYTYMYIVNTHWPYSCVDIYTYCTQYIMVLVS